MYVTTEDQGLWYSSNHNLARWGGLGAAPWFLSLSR
jgi:hypothetical protein